MKKQILTFLAGLLICLGAYTQAPEAINYQAVVRDGTGAMKSKCRYTTIYITG